MTKKQVLVLISCMILGVLLLGGLFLQSSIVKPIPHSSFSRKFVHKEDIEVAKYIHLGYNSFYFAGGNENTIYLGNWTAPLHLLEVKLPSLDTQHIILSIKDLEMPSDFSVFRLKVDSPFFYLSHGTLPGIYKGTLAKREARKFLPVTPPYFVDLTPVTPSLLALRSYSLDSKAYELATLELDSPYFRFNPDLLEKQVDGLFCEEGMLHYNKDLNELVYLYSYRNEFFVTDPRLKSLKRFHTLDTFSRVPVKIAHVTSGNYSTLASPPFRINVASATYGNELFVKSSLLAKNESREEFQDASVIDTYDLKTGEYLDSFYLANFNGTIADRFFVAGDCILAIYDRDLVLYKKNLTEKRKLSAQLIQNLSIGQE